MGSRKVMMIMIVLAAVTVLWAPSSDAQNAPSCIQALMPCAQYINATKPPATCCGPLAQAFKKQLPCLCSILNNPGLAAAANVNMTQALELPSKCGITDANDPNICKKLGSSAPVPVAEGPTALAPIPEAGGPPTLTPGKGSGAPSSVTWTGPLSSLMLLLAGLMFY
ncbi:unnamed protein product [Amaranthus hypochondriacus]